MPWTSNKRTGEIRDQQGRLIATTELGQRRHTELLGQAQNLRRALKQVYDFGVMPDGLAGDVGRLLSKTK